MDANDFDRCAEPGDTLVVSLVCRGAMHAASYATAALRGPTAMPGDRAGGADGCPLPTCLPGRRVIW